jgi:hypothetical protein
VVLRQSRPACAGLYIATWELSARRRKEPGGSQLTMRFAKTEITHYNWLTVLQGRTDIPIWWRCRPFFRSVIHDHSLTNHVSSAQIVACMSSETFYMFSNTQKLYMRLYKQS